MADLLKAFRAWISNILLQFPWHLEGGRLDLPIVGNGAPRHAMQAPRAQSDDRKLLEDDP